MRRIVAGGFAVAICCGLAVGAAGGSAPATGPICPLLAITGLPCPFCGMTRATFALGAGDLPRALALHPLAPLVLMCVLVAMVSIAAGRDRWLRKSPARVLGAIGIVWAVKLVAG